MKGNYINSGIEKPIIRLNRYDEILQNLKKNVVGQRVFSSLASNWGFQINPMVSFIPSVSYT